MEWSVDEVSLSEGASRYHVLYYAYTDSLVARRRGSKLDTERKQEEGSMRGIDAAAAAAIPVASSIAEHK